MITIELYELKNICFEMSQLGAASYAKQVTPEKDVLSQRQAYTAYGEARVKRWVQAGLIHSERSGSTSRSKIHYSRAEILSLECAIKMDQIINK